MLLAIYLAVGALAAEACTDPQSNTCEAQQCETVGGTQICMQCKTDGNVPINGICTAKTDGAVSAAVCKQTGGNAIDTDKVCGQCDGAYFLYKGGCYSTGDATGQKLCTKAAAGVCTQGAVGYFAVPGAAKTDQSVAACGDATTGVTVSGNKYIGVQNCAECDGSALQAGSAGTAKCISCQEGYYKQSESSCQQCNDQNCAVCSDVAANHCTKCKTDKYLTTTGTCDSACAADTHFSTETAESGKKCFACGDTTNGVDGCEKCTAPAQGKAKPTCTKCTDKYLKTAADGTTTCIAKEECKDGFFPVDDSSKGNKCISCGDTTNGVPNCAKCTLPSGAAKPTCSECASGYKLEGEACVPASTNLSTGAIAGISVAAVVVVGGLVGFLCWWFVCRGKA